MMFKLSTYLFFVAASLMACNNHPNPNTESTGSVTGKVLSEYPELPDWARSAVLYELNIRQFSEEGNFQGVVAQLERLKNLGVDVIWLMPIHPIGQDRRKGSLGSPYSVMDYYAVNPDFGTKEDLRALIQEAHRLGLKVILDWVPNHTSWDAVWKQNHPEYYTKINGDFTNPLNEHGEPIEDWSDICDLDYQQAPTRLAMIEAMRYWVNEFDIDGYRVDMAGLVPEEFWRQARPALDTLKPLFFLSEWQDEPAHFNSFFHVNYGWKWKDVTKDIWSGKQDAISLDTLHQFLGSFYPAHYAQLYFTQNHDENSWSGTEVELYGASADVMNVLAFTWQGMPMLYCGQEDGLNKRIKFFDKDPIRWKKYARTPFFQKLINLRHQNQALWTGKHGGPLEKFSSSDDKNIYAFGREKEGDRVIVIANLSKFSHTATVQIPAGYDGNYADVFGANTMQITGEMRLSLKPWEYLVLNNK